MKIVKKVFLVFFIVTMLSALFFIMKLGLNSEYEKGRKEVISRLSKYGGCEIINTDFTNQITGQIEKIQNNKIFVNIDIINILDDSNLDSRVVLIDSNTNLFKNIRKDKEAYFKEINDFNNKIMADLNEGGSFIPEPDINSKINLDVNDLKIGDNVLIISKENIIDKKEFSALEINVR